MDLSQLQYLPLALPHFSLLIVIFLVLVAWIEVRALRLAYMHIGFGPHAAVFLLLASLGGSYLNIPVARLGAHHIVSGREVAFFGMHYVIPVVVEWPRHDHRRQCRRRGDPGAALILSLGQE